MAALTATARAVRVLRAPVAALLVFLLLAPGAARAAAGWVESGDLGLRADLMLLNDAGVIRLPVSHWPIARAAVDYALERAKEHLVINRAVAMALDRTRARFAPVAKSDRPRAQVRYEGELIAGEPALLRQFGTLGRESAEIRGSASHDGEKYAGSLVVAGVADPSDGHEVRLDGTHFTAKFGNWLLSAGLPERFWGPSHESSLILSNNARPMPTITLERATAQAFDVPVLEWLGPWRFTLGVSRMESERLDIDAPLFLAWRVAIMPTEEFELGFSRTSQFCGEQLACDYTSIIEMLIGNDNVGIDASEANEPGNQMAGFDVRWSSPIGNLPYAVYSQMIGEDESGYLPVKYLAQFGLEVWKPMRDGGILQIFAEYADTTCSADRSEPRFGCAYNQTRFNIEGYRYRGRVIGHTTDRDAESYALGATLNASDGAVWSATARAVELNRDPADDPNNTVSSGPLDYLALEAGWTRRMFGGELAVQLGAEAYAEPGEEREIEPFGFISWRHSFTQ